MKVSMRPSGESAGWTAESGRERQRTRLNSTHTDIYPLSRHDALQIYFHVDFPRRNEARRAANEGEHAAVRRERRLDGGVGQRAAEDTAELHSHRYLPSFPTRRSSDLFSRRLPPT